jgi:hypothetical protein
VISSSIKIKQAVEYDFVKLGDSRWQSPPS